MSECEGGAGPMAVTGAPGEGLVMLLGLSAGPHDSRKDGVSDLLLLEAGERRVTLVSSSRLSFNPRPPRPLRLDR